MNGNATEGLRQRILFLAGAVIGAALMSFLLTGCAPGKYRLTEENDYFTLFNGDHDYTQGLEVSHTNQERTVAFGQKIFTPVHKKIYPAPKDERPYAGYVYGRRDVYQPVVDGNNTFVGLEVGLVGPGALGKEAQCGVHRLLGLFCPEGWPDQLDNEPGVTLRAGNSVRSPVEFLFMGGELEKHALITAGNVSTAVVGGMLASYRLAPFVRFFAGPDVHLVARDIFLDGNTFSSSPSVDKKWWYSELTAGFEFSIPRMPRITWYFKIQSEQYDGQDGAYNYGGVTIEWEK